MDDCAVMDANDGAYNWKDTLCEDNEASDKISFICEKLAEGYTTTNIPPTTNNGPTTTTNPLVTTTTIERCVGISRIPDAYDGCGAAEYLERLPEELQFDGWVETPVKDLEDSLNRERAGSIIKCLRTRESKVYPRGSVA